MRKEGDLSPNVLGLVLLRESLHSRSGSQVGEGGLVFWTMLALTRAGVKGGVRDASPGGEIVTLSLESGGK